MAVLFMVSKSFLDKLEVVRRPGMANEEVRFLKIYKQVAPTYVSVPDQTSYVYWKYIHRERLDM